MIEPKIQTITRNDRDISCAVWNENNDKTPVFCIHGLTRNGRDFDYLASSLNDSRTIYAPDVVGRGLSDWLPAGEIYNYDTYVEDTLHVLDTLGLEQVDWVGTSMGGLLGMRMACEYPSRIRKFVINDIAPVISVEAMQRLDDYVGQHMDHASLAEAENYIRICYGAFGLNKSWQWNHMLKHSVKPTEDGRVRMLYDPAIINGIRDEKGEMTLTDDINLWPLWENIPQPILLLRGEHSDFLSAAMAKEMCERHPNATWIEFKDCGHAPALMVDGQVNAVREWLDS
ncbi:MAG: alpha/beta hydrolase [Rickettsiales bacterium]|nr:alpha/beta hydrolase [Rickettsiales bacterium]